MKNIRISNKYGSVTLSGNGNESFSVTEVAGLGLPGLTLNSVSFAGHEGRETVSASRDFRTITIKGDVKGEYKDFNVRKFLKILSEPVILKVFSGNRTRCAECRCTNADIPFGKKAFYKTFVIQLECDSPYFLGEHHEEKYISKAADFLPLDYNAYFENTTKFISERITRADVINNGDVPAEPIITIMNTEGVAVSANGLLILNHSTGAILKFDYQTTPGEVIEINIPKRTVTSSLNTDMLDFLADECYLSDFILKEGNNDIELIPNDASEKLAAYVKFNLRYLEAMD